MEQADLEQEARFRAFLTKVRTANLERAAAAGDMEAVNDEARLISGRLGPEGLRGVSQFQMRELVAMSAAQSAALKSTLEQVAGRLVLRRPRTRFAGLMPLS